MRSLRCAKAIGSHASARNRDREKTSMSTIMSMRLDKNEFGARKAHVVRNPRALFVFDLRAAFASANRSAYHNEISGMKTWVPLFAALASASPVVAQESTPPLVAQHSQSITESLFKGGPVVFPL